LWAPVSVGPEHSPVGSKRWMDGRRRGGKGIGGKGRGKGVEPLRGDGAGRPGVAAGATRSSRRRGRSGAGRPSEGANDLAGWAPAGDGVAGWWWWQGEGPRLDVYMCVSRVDFVDWCGRWCGSLSSTHSIYISTQ